MIKVLVSSCLMGEAVRYHGGDAPCTSGILDRWRAEGRLVVACPETAGQGVTAALLSQAGIRLFNERQLEQADAYLRELEAAAPPT